MADDNTVNLDDASTRVAERQRLCDIQGWRCVYCGGEMTQFNATIDHVVPRHRGGHERRDNLVACCRECNVAKGQLTLQEFMPEVQDWIAEAANLKWRSAKLDLMSGFPVFEGLDRMVKFRSS